MYSMPRFTWMNMVAISGVRISTGMIRCASPS